MKKKLLGLFVSFISFIWFWYCLTPNYTYNNVQNFYGINNQYSNNDSFLCFNSLDIQNYSFNEFAIRDNYNSDLLIVNGNWIKFIWGLRCAFIPSGTDYISISWQEPTWQLQSMNFYQFLLGGSCEGSDWKINFIDSYTNNTTWLPFNLNDWDSFIYNIYYNSNNTPISVNNSSSVVNLASKYDNIECESHVSFSDISNSTWVKFLNSLFSPFSWANNVSVYYDSQENVVQVDNQNWVAEIVSVVPSTPPTPCDCSEAISWAVASCNNQLTTLSWNYNSCLWELSSCMSNSWSSCSWSWTNWSALFINNIQHLWKPIINITIPEEINWDYNSTWDLFDLNVVWYNVDYDKINWIINLQNTKPTEEDFNKIVSEVVPLLVPWLFIIAFIYFVFRFIRKLF